MTPFLHHIANLFYARYGADLYKHTFVFPNKRAGVFFQKYLAEIAAKPVFSPNILTTQELFEVLSPYRAADKIEMLVMLYRHYARIGGSDETFDDFLFWGEILLNDFNDVDKHVADARQVFKNIRDLKSLDGDMSYLSEMQIEAIRRFWTNFMPVEGNDTKRKFQETWKILFELYTDFRAELHQKVCAYEGMLFREVAERAKRKENIALPFSDIVFVGMNALTPAENHLFTYLRDIGIADFYWDYHSPLVRDPNNRASLWVQENLLHFPSKFDLPETVSSDLEEKCQIQLVGIPSAVGQAKHVTQILSQLIQSEEIKDEGINTAIVLPDENLLLPTLYSIPEEIAKINVTMGYGLSHASVASLVEHIAQLQQNIRTAGGGAVFYFRFVLSVLNHPLVGRAAKAHAETLKKRIVDGNRVTVSADELGGHPLTELIFKSITRWQDVSEYLQAILSAVYESVTDEKHSRTDEPHNVRAFDLEREFIVQYYKTVTRLHDTLRGVAEMSVGTYFRLLKRLAQGISVSFSGEPLSGLQVMGVLETRVLDFENLILLSMNEGVFPAKNAVNSFIPYTLRKAFGLPVHEHQDSTYAYHFYRMIGRARRVFMLYDTRAEEMQTGEVSRYFNQIKYLYGNDFEIDERVLNYDVSSPETLPVSVRKTADVLSKLDKFRTGGTASLSASLVNSYINCPLQFYFSAVEDLQEEDGVSESVESDVFGSIFHRLMEIIYNRFVGHTVTPDAVTEIARNETYLTEIIEKAFARYYFKDERNPRSLQGQHYLIGEILRSYVKQTLEADKRFMPFEYVGSEHKIDETYRVDDALAVNFKGSIDRIDRVGAVHRIIDYKTGTGATDFKDIAQLFDASRNNRPKQILQVFVYALFYGLENPGTPLAPAVYYLRSVFRDFDPSVTCQKTRVDDTAAFMPEFTERFNALLHEIFDPAVPFSQTPNEKNCEWCPFRGVCGR